MDTSIELPPFNVAALLRQHGLHPKKGLGQNFLVDPVALRRVVEAAEVTSQDAVLEVGAGLGSLTRYLAVAARRVTAVELDRQLIPLLDEVLAPFPNVEVRAGDMLEIDPVELMGEPGFLVVANIPYYITSALIRHLLEASARPKRLALTVQKEVAQRICATPGEMSLLALSVQVYGEARIMARIPAGSFYPAPKVDSSMVRVDIFPEPVIAAGHLESFFRLAKAGFSQKRKNLRNSLSGGLHWAPEAAEALLEAVGIDPRRRAETLSLPEWNQLVLAYERGKQPSKDN